MQSGEHPFALDRGPQPGQGLHGDDRRARRAHDRGDRAAHRRDPSDRARQALDLRGIEQASPKAREAHALIRARVAVPRRRPADGPRHRRGRRAHPLGRAVRTSWGEEGLRGPALVWEGRPLRTAFLAVLTALLLAPGRAGAPRRSRSAPATTPASPSTPPAPPTSPGTAPSRPASARCTSAGCRAARPPAQGAATIAGAGLLALPPVRHASPARRVQVVADALRVRHRRRSPRTYQFTSTDGGNTLRRRARRSATSTIEEAIAGTERHGLGGRRNAITGGAFFQSMPAAGSDEREPVERRTSTTAPSASRRPGSCSTVFARRERQRAVPAPERRGRPERRDHLGRAGRDRQRCTTPSWPAGRPGCSCSARTPHRALTVRSGPAPRSGRRRGVGTGNEVAAGRALAGPGAARLHAVWPTFDANGDQPHPRRLRRRRQLLPEPC